MTLTLVPKKGLTTRHTHVKYESSITYHSKLMANLKNVCRQTVIHTNRQGQLYSYIQTDKAKLYSPNLCKIVCSKFDRGVTVKMLYYFISGKGQPYIPQTVTRQHKDYKRSILRYKSQRST